MKTDLLKELKSGKEKKGFEATKVTNAKQPKDQKHSSDTRAKVLSGIHKRTHIASKSSKGMVAGIPK